MKEIKLNKIDSDQIVSEIKTYFQNELDYDIGAFEAEFLIEFFAKQIGAHYYNQGLSDAHQLFSEKSEEISYLIQELEQTTF